MKTVLVCLLSAASLAAQQPQVENAKVESHALSGSLQAELARHGAGPFWAAWAEPEIPGRHGDMCWSSVNNGVYEDGHA
ncbi:MAG: hypothetical protein KGN84_12540, partial [Acidobacteriota bacterium]|nr:hypothetical protein [Acidobacteriota bacterium]